jgi:[acyl-carrier-protein] S-malonyltransferase
MRVFLYAGQGAQFVGMGKDLYEEFPAYKKTVDSIELPFDHIKLMHEGPAETLNDTAYTQPCYASFAAGVTAVLEEAGIRPEAACGLSLGEYGALYAAGVWDTKTYVDLVAFRGKVMADAVKGMTYSMSAILGTGSAEVEEACEKLASKGFVTVANYNCPGQYVICGEEAAVAAVEEYMKENFKAKCARLNTTSPFHTSLLKSAGDALKEKFGDISFGTPKIPVAMNVTGKLLSESDDIKYLLEMQVQKSVRFEDDITTLINMGADDFIEIGPGNVLTGLCKKTARKLGAKVNTVTIQKAEDLKKLLG